MLDTVRSGPTYIICECHRTDEFGVPIPYSFALAENALDAASVAAITKAAKRRQSHLVVVAEEAPTGSLLTLSEFKERCGGPINSLRPLDPAFPAQLVELGHNRPVTGLSGKPDELFEDYVQEALQFMLWDRVIRYGQSRRFEDIPDGIAFAGEVVLMYDAKAYTDGYPLTKESIRQFSDYVRAFHRRYEKFLGRIHSFIVVSGSFASGAKAQENKSRQLYEECGVRISYLLASELAVAVTLLANHPGYRSMLNWRSIFSQTHITASLIEKELDARKRDELVKR